MTSSHPRVRHAVLIAALLSAAVLVAVLVGNRGAGSPDPRDLDRPAAELAARSTYERDRERLVFGLQCMAALASGKYRAALSFCEFGIAQNQDDVTLLKLRGSAHFFLGHWKPALADFNRVIALTPDDPDSYRLRGATYASTHHDKAALADFDRALALSPDDPVLLEFRGYFFETRRQYGRAIADFLASIKAQPNNYHAWNSLCWTMFLARRGDKSALVACNRAIALNPQYMNSFDSRGFVLLRLGRYRSSLRDFNTVLAVNPAFPSSLYGRGIVKAYLHDASASADIARAKQLDPGIEARVLAYGVHLPVTGTSGT